ncbi:MAG TPA: TrkA C-terminal domain-containing protein [Chloroflexota bacterium]|nr:TrkA C-terminal domain-containing protein [Chloroflexota bacterium]
MLRAYNARLEQSLDKAEQQEAPATQSAAAGPARADGGAKARTGAPPAASSDATLLGRLHDHRIVDLELTPGHSPVGCRVRDVAWPPSTLVVAIRRGAEAFTPNGQTELRAGDRLTVLLPAQYADQVADIAGTTQPVDHANGES